MPKEEKDPRFEIEIAKIQILLKEIGGILKGAMPEGYGFTLLIYSYGKKGSLFYMSSAERADMIKTMQEFIDRQPREEAKEKEFWKKKAN